MMLSAQFEQQLQFLLEIDKLKSIQRRSILMDGSRRENSAEHSWHIAVAALLLAGYANETIDVCRVIKMLLLHDLVEIDAGDTFIYDDAARSQQLEREQSAARRIFGLLPDEQAGEWRMLWDEFEARSTPEAKFARAMDRLMPILHNYQTEGGSWRANGVHKGQVVDRVNSIGEGAQFLWDYVQSVLDDAVAKGYLLPDPGATKGQ